MSVVLSRVLRRTIARSECIYKSNSWLSRSRQCSRYGFGIGSFFEALRKNFYSQWHSKTGIFKSGKVPPQTLKEIVFPNCGLNTLPSVLVGPALGIDGAVVKTSGRPIAVSSDPITGSINDLGRLVVHVNANDIAVMGAKPMYLVLTILMPSGSTESELQTIMEQVHTTCLELGVSVIGGHTEVTSAVNQPIASGTMIGEVLRHITAGGVQVGDHIVLTKAVALEGTAILLSEKGDDFVRNGLFSREEVDRAKSELSSQFSIVPEAHLAIQIPEVTGMHDPTEGGLANALHELSEASNTGFFIDYRKINIRKDTVKICNYFNIDALNLISSGALLITVNPSGVNQLIEKLKLAGIPASDIGNIVADNNEKRIYYKDTDLNLHRPVQDAIWDVLKIQKQ